MMPRWLLILVLLLPAPASASTPDLSELAYTQHPGNQLPLLTPFHDETGRTLQLADLFVGKPVIVTLGYFECPNLCGIVRDDLLHALTESGLRPGDDYTMIVVSIDPTESSGTANIAKAKDLGRYPTPGADHAWHYLVGPPDAVAQLAAAAGFKDRSDPVLRQFIHPAGIVFVTPSGRISSYLLGVGYRPGDVRLGVTRAATGTLAQAALPILLLCFHYDPATGRYTLAILKLLEIACALTALVVGGTIALALRHEGPG